MPAHASPATVLNIASIMPAMQHARPAQPVDIEDDDAAAANDGAAADTAQDVRIVGPIIACSIPFFYDGRPAFTVTLQPLQGQGDLITMPIYDDHLYEVA